MQRANSLEKTLKLGKIEGWRRRGGRGWDGWMVSLTQWTWVWASCRRQRRTGKPGTLQPKGLQRAGCELANKQQFSDGKTSSCENTPWATRVWSLGWEDPWVGKFFWRRERQSTCLENSMDREAWQATVHGVTKSWTWLSDWHTHTDIPEVSNVILKLLELLSWLMIYPKKLC